MICTRESVASSVQLLQGTGAGSGLGIWDLFWIEEVRERQVWPRMTGKEGSCSESSVAVRPDAVESLMWANSTVRRLLRRNLLLSSNVRRRRKDFGPDQLLELGRPLADLAA